MITLYSRHRPLSALRAWHAGISAWRDWLHSPADRQFRPHPSLQGGAPGWTSCRCCPVPVPLVSNSADAYCRLADDHAFNALSIPAGRMRVSIGLEDMSALAADIEQAIDACEWNPSLTCLVAPTTPPMLRVSRTSRALHRTQIPPRDYSE
ncbi:hypothetical protein [Burkholderia ubonensis]|uniref:hypothetical protein n=1 Tax=Burkholderia ubonensis TaxID=101571 RepID=UPI001114E83C|nr:hypothetical protein [Burkholderia ubonensis]